MLIFKYLESFKSLNFIHSIILANNKKGGLEMAETVSEKVDQGNGFYFFSDDTNKKLFCEICNKEQKNKASARLKGHR